MSVSSNIISVVQRIALEFKSVRDAIALKASVASPALTGTPTAPTASPGTDTDQIASTSYVQTALAGVGGGSPVFPASLIKNSQYRLADVTDGGANHAIAPDVIGLLITRQTVRVKVKSIIIQQTIVATASALLEIGLYDGTSGTLVASFGTVDLVTSTGMKEMTLASSVEIPELAVWAVKLRSSSSNSGAYRRCGSNNWHNIGNTWDPPTGVPRALSVSDPGTGALPSTLPTTASGSAHFPVFGITMEAIE